MQSLTIFLLILVSLGSSQPTCDESKCRNRNPNLVPRYWWLLPAPTEFPGGYTCWADSQEDFACAEGYIGKPIPNVTKQQAADEALLQWYTCCPEEEDKDYVQPKQTCSDANCDPMTSTCWAAPDGLAPKQCQEGEFPYPRDTGAVLEMVQGHQQFKLQQFVCCTEPTTLESEHDNDLDGDRLPDDCSATACTSLNGVKGGAGDCWADGVTEPFTCSGEDGFVHPTLNGHDDFNMYNFHYVCCQTKDGSTYVMENTEDDGLVIALTIQATISFVTFVITSTFTAAILTNKKARNTSWNIYLVMLAIPDAVYNCFRFGYNIVVITRSNTFVETTWMIDWFYAVANLLLNAAIVYQVHTFLRALRNGFQIQAPTIRSVFIQSFVVYTVAISCGVWMFYLHTIGNDFAGGSHEQFLKIHRISVWCMVSPPLLFVALVCFDVWRRKLLPSGDGRHRILAIYFLRVIFVFTVTWLPYLLLVTFGLRSTRVLTYIGMCISSTQGTLSVVVAMSKTDVHWALKSFCMGKCNAEAPSLGSSHGQKGMNAAESTTITQTSISRTPEQQSESIEASPSTSLDVRVEEENGCSMKDESFGNKSDIEEATS